MLSDLVATEACYTIKENNNKEKLFCWGKLPFCPHKLPFAVKNWKLFYIAFFFFYQHKLPFWQQKLSKAYFASAFSCQGEKIWIARVVNKLKFILTDNKNMYKITCKKHIKLYWSIMKIVLTVCTKRWVFQVTREKFLTST